MCTAVPGEPHVPLCGALRKKAVTLPPPQPLAVFDLLFGGLEQFASREGVCAPLTQVFLCRLVIVVDGLRQVGEVLRSFKHDHRLKGGVGGGSILLLPTAVTRSGGK